MLLQFYIVKKEFVINSRENGLFLIHKKYRMSDNKNKPKLEIIITPTGQITEGVDFYIENGLFVFTEKYLKERGYCCGNGCRHCPYKKIGDE